MPAPLPFTVVRTLLAGMAALCLAGCVSTPASEVFTTGADAPGANTAGKVEIGTGRLLTKMEIKQLLPHAFVGDEVYAEVNSAWLASYYDVFRAELFRLGITKWDARFDCNRFAELYSGIAQAVYLRATFHSNHVGGALAIGPYWYRRANGQGMHAIVQILTERGVVYVDPQTGGWVQLTPAEKASAYLQVI